MERASLQSKTRREKRKDAGSVVLSPRITEKGAVIAERNAYVFNVAASATKKEISRAIEELLKVRPVRVRVARTPGKRSFTRGTNRFGRSAAVKKAYVYLRKGETLDLA